MVITIGSLMPSQSQGQTSQIANQKAARTNNLTWSANLTVSESSTNPIGLSSNLRVENYQGNLQCTIDINNKATNTLLKCWNIYQVNLLKVDLLDSGGKPVKKTELGMQCGKILGQQEWEVMAQKRRIEWSSGRARTSGFGPLVAAKDHQYGTRFYISDLFILERAGQYTLHVQMPLIYLDGNKFKTSWLPEVTSKIQLRSGVIFQTNPPATSQTNSPSK